MIKCGTSIAHICTVKLSVDHHSCTGTVEFLEELMLYTCTLYVPLTWTLSTCITLANCNARMQFFTVIIIIGKVLLYHYFTYYCKTLFCMDVQYTLLYHTCLLTQKQHWMSALISCVAIKPLKNESVEETRMHILHSWMRHKSFLQDIMSTEHLHTCIILP